MTKEHHDQISRRTGIVGFFTLISRFAGLVRDAVLAYAFGASRSADAFYVAFRIPNLLRRLVAEGAMTISFIPIYTEYLKRSRESAREAASVIFTFLAMFLVVLVLVGILFAPWIVRVVAWGFADDPEKFTLTVYLTRLMFPYIFLISLVALTMGILNSLKKFAAPAATPILLNLGIIFGALVLSRFFEIPAVGVACGVLVGGILQLALEIPPLIKEGMLPRISFQPKHPALKSLLLMMIPSAFGAAVYQINVLIVTFFASFLPAGSVSYLWYADRISEFPLGIFAISVATASLPTLSEHAAEKDMTAFKETMNYSLRLAFLISIPAAVGLYLLSEPIVRVLFERGQFDAVTSTATAGALAIFALKIPFVAGVRNLAPGFFALRDTKTPVMVSALDMGVNIIAALLLMGPMLHRGLALALVISASANFLCLLVLFRRKVGPIGGRKLLHSISRTVLASAFMAGGLLVVETLVPLKMMSKWALAGFLFPQIGLAVIIFVFVIRVLNPHEYRALMHMVRLRRARSSACCK